MTYFARRLFLVSSSSCLCSQHESLSLELIVADFTLLTLFCFSSRGCPNSAPISFMTVTLLITHAGNDFLETRDIIPYRSVSRKGLSVLLLTRGQHKFGLLCCFCCFASKHQTCATNGSSYFQHLYPNPIRNHASGRWLRSHMQRKSHFDFIFRRQMKGKVKRL